MNMDLEIYCYNIGYRDSVATTLAEYYNKIKLPDLAKIYKEIYKEEHFSHKWHTEL
jgi:hypothetical protein